MNLIPPEHEPFEKPTYNKIYPRRIVVKLHDDVDVEIPELEKQNSGLRIGRLITNEENQAIEERLARVKEFQEPDPTYIKPNFLNFLIITVPLNQEPEEIVKDVQGLWGDKIEYIYIRSLPAPSPAVTPDDEGDISKQGYIEPHDTSAFDPDNRTYGVDARYAWENWGHAGGAGADIKFIDLEHGWFLNHSDLPAGISILHGINIGDIPAQDFPSNVNLNPAQEQAHGTWTLGVVAAADNSQMILGIAAEADVDVVSPWKLMDVPPVDPMESPYEHDIAQAILGAIWHLDFGDVLLLEAQIRGEGAGDDSKYEPVELEYDTFSMICLATALGIIVIEAAGNGRYNASDLDGGAYDLGTRPRRANPHAGVNVLDTSTWITDEEIAKYDSKAIIVGAATHRHPHRRIDNTMLSECNPPPFPGYDPRPSNYGSRVDCYAWGQCVYTIGDVTGSANGITANFNGTSSASAIVAGVAVVAQAVARHLPIPVRINSELMRTIFHDYGIDSANPPADRIGKMPNLRDIIDNALNLPDVYIRDYVGDGGEPHNNGILSRSPDIIVLQDTANNLGIDLGTATESLDNLNQPVELGQTNYVYVRVKNRGSAAALNVKADVYYALPSTLITPPWNEVGSVIIPSVPANNTLTVSSPIAWNDIPDVDHYCFVALIGHEKDPAPPLAQFDDFDWYYGFIRQNNNAAWRNFNVINDIDDAGATGMEFHVAGPPDRDRNMELEFISDLPPGTQIWLEADPPFFRRLTIDTPLLVRDLGDISRRLSLDARGTVRLGPILLQRRERTPVQLRVQLPPQWRTTRPYTVFVRQLYRDVEVGRITWRLNLSRTIRTL